jgi:hypothetical protein
VFHLPLIAAERSATFYCQAMRVMIHDELIISELPKLYPQDPLIGPNFTRVWPVIWPVCTLPRQGVLNLQQCIHNCCIATCNCMEKLALERLQMACPPPPHGTQLTPRVSFFFGCCVSFLPPLAALKPTQFLWLLRRSFARAI